MQHEIDEAISKEAEGYFRQIRQPMEAESPLANSSNHSLHLLLPVGSDSHESTTLFWAAADLANRLPLSITILHCRQWDLAKGVKYFLETKDEAASIITSATNWFTALNIAAHGVLCDVERGGIARAIAETSVDYHVDSIMIGLRHKNRRFAGLRGSTVARIERLVECPIIIIKVDDN